MRLYLSSYQLGDHPGALSALVTGRRHGWVIMNALDGVDPERRHRDTQGQIVDLARLGLTAHELDLRDHDPGSLPAAFGQPDFLWVRGGNVFTLRAALARSGADTLITNRVRADALVYAGFSAGACVLAPDLTGLEACDSSQDAMDIYGRIDFTGLGILDRPLVPHLDSPQHPENTALTEVAATYARNDQPYWALCDGQALVINGNNTTLL